MNKLFGLIVIASITAVSLPASADIFLFSASLDGTQEVPPNDSLGFGSVLLSFDDTTNILEITSGSYEDLMTSITLSHIHQAPFGLNGGVLFPLDHTGGTSGTLSGSGELFGDEITSLFAEGLYINVHTSGFPGGEIRGQIVAVPAPGALGLFLAAGFFGKKRRRS